MPKTTLNARRNVIAFTRRMGKQIRAARRDAGMTLDELCHCIGHSKPYMINIEYGRTSPKAIDLERIAQATQKPINFFYSRTA